MTFFLSSGITGVHPALPALVPFFPLHVPKRHPQHYRISLSPNQNGSFTVSHVSSNPYIHVCSTRALLYRNVSLSKRPHNFLLKYWPHSSGFYLPGPTPWTLILSPSLTSAEECSLGSSLGLPILFFQLSPIVTSCFTEKPSYKDTLKFYRHLSLQRVP